MVFIRQTQHIRCEIPERTHGKRLYIYHKENIGGRWFKDDLFMCNKCRDLYESNPFYFKRFFTLTEKGIKTAEQIIKEREKGRK